MIHTAFSHDFSKFAENGLAEKAAIETLSAVLAGSGRPLVVTSGLAFLGGGRLATEDDTVPAGAAHVPRDPETPTLAAAANGVRASLVRLSPTVHGKGDHGFVPMLIGIARDKGVSAYVGAGDNTWPAVHRFDAARLFRLALENGVAGARYHAAAEQGLAFRDIATAIGRGLNLPVVSMSPEEAGAHFGWFAPLCRHRLPGLERQDPGRTGLAAAAARADRRPRCGPLFRPVRGPQTKTPPGWRGFRCAVETRAGSGDRGRSCDRYPSADHSHGHKP